MGELVVVVVENWLQVHGADATPALEQDMLESITHARAQASRSVQVHMSVIDPLCTLELKLHWRMRGSPRALETMERVQSKTLDNRPE